MKKNLLLLGILMSYILLFTSCATKLDSISNDEVLNSNNGYISGSFNDTNFYFLNILRNSPYSILLENSATNEKFTFKFGLKDDYIIYNIPEGSYRVKSISKIESERETNGTYTQRSYYLNVPEELLFDFNVEKGKITYIGDIKIKSKGFLIFKIDRTEFIYNVDNASNFISDKYEYINKDDVLSIY